jgi:hypothetical protein
MDLKQMVYMPNGDRSWQHHHAQRKSQKTEMYAWIKNEKIEDKEKKPRECNSTDVIVQRKRVKQRRNSSALRISQRYAMKIPICSLDGNLIPCILHNDDFIYMDIPCEGDSPPFRIHALIIDIHYDMIAKAGRIRIRVLPDVRSVVRFPALPDSPPPEMPTISVSDRVFVLASSEAVRIIRPLKVTCIGEERIEGSKAWLAYGHYAKFLRAVPMSNMDPVVMHISEIPVQSTDSYEYVDTRSILSLDEYLHANYFTRVPPYAMIKGECEWSQIRK